MSVLNCNFSKEQSMVPEDDGMIETTILREHTLLLAKVTV